MYAVIDRVVALIMKLEPEEFWRLESEGIRHINAGVRNPFMLHCSLCSI